MTTMLLVAQAPTPAQPGKTPRVPIRIAPDVTVIEAPGLTPDGALATRNPDQLEQQRGGYIQTDTTSSGRTGLPSRTGMEATESNSADAMCLYAITLGPKERLQIKLKAEDNQIIMRFITPPVATPMTPAIRSANMPPTPLRRTRIQIANPGSEPAETLLLLYGKAGYPYRLELTRK
jgi:hypothetical protein